MGKAKRVVLPSKPKSISQSMTRARGGGILKKQWMAKEELDRLGKTYANEMEQQRRYSNNNAMNINRQNQVQFRKSSRQVEKLARNQELLVRLKKNAPPVLLPNAQRVKPFTLTSNKYLKTLKNRQLQNQAPLESQEERLTKFLSLLKRLARTNKTANSNKFYEVEDETLRAFTMLSPTMPLHVRREVVLTLDEQQFAEFLVLLYLDCMHDMLRNVVGTSAQFLEHYPLERFVKQLFYDEEYFNNFDKTRCIFYSLNENAQPVHLQNVLGSLAKAYKSNTISQGFEKYVSSRSAFSPFLYCIFRGYGTLPILKANSLYHTLRNVSDFEDEAIRGVTALCTQHDQYKNQYRKRSFPINELPKRRNSKILVDMSSTGATRFFAKHARQVLSLPSVADEGISMLKEMDVLRRIKSQWKNQSRNKSRNVALNDIMNDLQNRIAPTNLKYLQTGNALKFQNVVRDLSSEYYNQTFYYYRLLNVLNKQHKNRKRFGVITNKRNLNKYGLNSVRKNGKNLSSSNAWQIQELKTFLLTMKNPQRRAEFKQMLQQFMNAKRKNILDIGRFTIKINVRANGNPFDLTMFSFDMDLNNMTKTGKTDTGRDGLERIKLGNPSNASTMFMTSIWSAKSTFEILEKYNKSKEEMEKDGPSTGLYKAVMSKFLGDFCQYMFALTNTWTCKNPQDAKFSSITPTIFASGDRMTVVGYLLMHKFLQNKDTRMNLYTSKSKTPIQAKLDLSKTSVVYEDASVFSANEISVRRTFR